MNFANSWNVFWGVLKNEFWQQLLLKGIKNTIEIAVFGLIIGIVLGTIIALVKVAPKYKLIMRILDKICSIYVALFRGTPMVVQLLIAYYVLLPLLGIKGVNALNVGIIVFGMNSGAYVSEIMRGGINSVDKGQIEAGRAVGLSYPITMIKIVIPQAVKNIVPTLGNEFITLIKETSVVSFITVYDLYTVMKAIAGKTYDSIMPYLFMAVIYIVLVLIITLLIKLVEKAFARSDRRTA
ncbi:MAG: amino acid ABC transporter permease [Candidatus Borkfalkiaceae bacterium]|nr:amino acid ABC transporter permease [bacterium]MDY2851298.1 amino acid ABC transporter permease [Christensenellaceae bacterium]